MAKNTVQFRPRPSDERGNADHGWLKTFHTFSFASYASRAHNAFGCLRVINEDRVAPKTGFGTHAHREFEIFSYVVSGELQHNDSMGNTEVLKRGDLQMTSAGTGIRHSEHAHGNKQVHFLQIWALPSQSNLKPAYYTRHFSDEQKKDQWAHIVAPISAPSAKDAREATGPAPVHAPLSLYATLLSPEHSLQHTVEAAGASRKAYVHVVQTSGYNPDKAGGATVKVSSAGAEDVVLREGDGVYVDNASGAVLEVANVGDGVAEVLLFEME
ncbi:pirin domain-containing protein [Auriscalpium vulgare]|uniref:Pirin domain-containing protein n=1 Tax=Auriscalpium vulgare TaxID=40419 RepID=A0ACB8RXX3_9AGAM|nr:pirin domain-containing protein [Auriscalpium vulgare]